MKQHIEREQAMNARKRTVEGTAEAWEDGTLGLDVTSAKKASLSVDEVSAAVGLKSISIRMQPDLLDELKMIADFHGVGYQPLMKQVLRRFVDAEVKRIVKQAHSELEAEDKTVPENDRAVQDCA